MTRVHAVARALSTLAFVWLTQACIAPTENCTTTRNVAGRWQYRATQETPVRGTLSGTLTVSSQSCMSFQGALDVVEVSGNGVTRRLAGPVNGVLVDSSSARFDATLNGALREHLARFGADSVWGSWVEVQSAASASGSFAGRLQETK